MNNTEKKLYLEALRIIAIFCVLYNHTIGYILGWQQEVSVAHFIYLAVTMTDRLAVPLFFMISGALLLPKEENLAVIWKKRVVRFLLLILFINTVVYVQTLAGGCIEGNPLSFDFMEWLHILFTGADKSYWYLYAYLSALIMLPFLRGAGKIMNKSLMLYLIGGHALIYTLIPAVNFFLQGTEASLELSAGFALPLMTESCIFYMLLGNYLENLADSSLYTGKNLLKLAVLSFTGVAIEVIFTHVYGMRHEFGDQYVLMFDYLIAITAFVGVKMLFVARPINRNSKGACFLEFAGGLTLGMYLFDPIVSKLCRDSFTYFLAGHRVPMIFAAVAYCLLSMILCGTFTWLLKKIPLMKKLL